MCFIHAYKITIRNSISEHIDGRHPSLMKGLKEATTYPKSTPLKCVIFFSISFLLSLSSFPSFIGGVPLLFIRWLALQTIQCRGRGRHRHETKRRACGRPNGHDLQSRRQIDSLMYILCTLVLLFCIPIYI